jgi:hypothetical protein
MFYIIQNNKHVAATWPVEAEGERQLGGMKSRNK